MHVLIATGPNLPVPALRGGAVHRFWSEMAPALVRLGAEVTVYARADRAQAACEELAGVRYLRAGGFDARGRRWYDYPRSLLYALAHGWLLPRADVYITNDAFMPWVMAARGLARRTLVAIGRASKGQFRYYPAGLHCAVPTQAIARQLASEAPQLAARCAVLPYAIDVERQRQAAQRQAGPRAGRLLYAGRIHPEKGIEVLLSAFRLLCVERGDLRLRVIGPYRADQGGAGADYRERLSRAHADLPVEWCEPEFDADALARHYAQAQVFVYPSLAEQGETFGVAPLEAMAAGAVPVVSALACFDDFIEDGVTGLRFDHRGQAPALALCAALRQALADSDRLALAAQRRAAAYTVDAVAQRWFDHLQQMHAGA
ncbi:MAG: glycosyltransferase family 4 protein [Lysobacterales bacterium]